MKFEDIIISILENELVLSDTDEENLGKISAASVTQFKDILLSTFHFEGDKNLLHYLAAAPKKTQKAVMRVIDPLQIGIMLQQKADLLTPAMIAEHCTDNGFYEFMQMAMQHGCFFIFAEYFNNNLLGIYNPQLDKNTEFKEFIVLLQGYLDDAADEFKEDNLFDIKQISAYELSPYKYLRNLLLHQNAKSLHLQACKFLAYMLRELNKADKKFYNKEDCASAFNALKDYEPKLKFLGGLIAKLFFDIPKHEEELAQPEAKPPIPLPPVSLLKAVSNAPWLRRANFMGLTVNTSAGVYHPRPRLYSATPSPPAS